MSSGARKDERWGVLPPPFVAMLTLCSQEEEGEEEGVGGLAMGRRGECRDDNRIQPKTADGVVGGVESCPRKRNGY